MRGQRLLGYYVEQMRASGLMPWFYGYRDDLRSRLKASWDQFSAEAIRRSIDVAETEATLANIRNPEQVELAHPERRQFRG